MRLNSATLFVASMLMDDGEFRAAMDEWEQEIEELTEEDEKEDEKH